MIHHLAIVSLVSANRVEPRCTPLKRWKGKLVSDLRRVTCRDCKRFQDERPMAVAWFAWPKARDQGVV